MDEERESASMLRAVTPEISIFGFPYGLITEFRCHQMRLQGSEKGRYEKE